MKVSLGAGLGGVDRSEHRSTRPHNGGGGTGTGSAPLVSIQGWIRATIFGAQPNQRLELAPPLVVEIEFGKTQPGRAAQPPPRKPRLQAHSHGVLVRNPSGPLPPC